MEIQNNYEIMPIKIQYASDLHIEYEDILSKDKFDNIIKPSAPILILAGDICNPYTQRSHDFLSWTVSLWEKVFYVAGNHEYYGSSLQKTNKYLEKLSQKIGFIFLQNNSYICKDKNIVLLGTTLWSHIPKNYENIVQNTINDYRLIKLDKNLLRPEETSELFSKSFEWLKENVEKYKKLRYKIIIITHHAPYPEITSNPIHRGKNNNCAFSSDCSSIFEGVNYWIFGHTHYSTKIKINNTILIANQRGYKKEITEYSEEATFDI